MEWHLFGDLFTRFIVTVQPIWDRKYRAWTCSVVEILGLDYTGATFFFIGEEYVIVSGIYHISVLFIISHWLDILHVLFIHQNFNSSSPSIERSTLQKVCEFFRWQQFRIYWPDRQQSSMYYQVCESSNSISCSKFHIEKKCWGIINLDNHYSRKPGTL
jgi:hypothetical protein